MGLLHTQEPASVSDGPRTGANMQISRHWLQVARGLLLAISALVFVLYIAGTPIYFSQLHTLHTACNYECLTPAKAQSLHVLGISITTYAVYWMVVNVLFALVYFVVATLIFWRKSDDRMALFASFFLVALGASFPDIPNALAAIHPVWQLPVTFVSALGLPSLAVFFFLFPNGRFVLKWTRWVAGGFAAIYALSAFFPVSLFSIKNLPRLLTLLVLLIVFGSMLFAQIHRYRQVSTAVERQQTKWVVFGATIALLGFLLLGLLPPRFIDFNQIALLPSTILQTSIYLVLLLIPFSLAIAILRYRLWDVDVLINKALVYGLLTGTLAVIYAVCIVGLQTLFQGVFKQNSDVVIVASTLFIAALFQPLRKRIQAVIDRRFYRRKYDAARTLATLSATLRDEVDLSQLSEQLVAVVQETMQPAQDQVIPCLSQRVKGWEGHIAESYTGFSFS